MKQERNAYFVKALETAKPNKNFAKKEKLRQKRREKDAKDEWPPLRNEKLKALKDAKKAPTKSAKSGKAEAAAKDKATPAKSTKKSKRRVINEIANAATGRESLRKAQARALVEKKKKEAKADAQAKAKATRAQKGADAKESVKKNKKSLATAAAVPADADHTADNAKHDGDEDLVVPALSTSEVERALLQRTICGDDHLGLGGGDPHRMEQREVRDDPTLYPALAFFDDYAEKKSGDAVSEDKILSDANHYFRDLRRRERQLNVAAVKQIAKMREINRRGGDKDGFRYVVPRNTKRLVRQMLLNGAHLSEEADVDPDTLVSTFLGDGVEGEVSDKPQRRHRKRSSTYSDFYQFQVSKRWTHNAERFLKRGRANKSMFEAKKRQRSIRKL